MARKSKQFVMNGLEIVEALGAITKEKNISIELAINSLEDALAQAAKKMLPSPANVNVEIDRVTGVISAYSYQLVVADDEIEDLYTQIQVSEAREDIDPKLNPGDEIVEDENLDVSTFGRAAIQIAKQIIMQRVREHERMKIFNDFSERVGDMVTGTVQQVERGNVIVNLGRTEALLPKSQQIRGERYHQGETVKGIIHEVKDMAKGAQVILSRTSPDFLKRLFEVEVPEVFEGIVRITRVVRAPGYRAKLAVESTDPRVDPVGACVGMRGNRIQSIVRELSNERMDIINWSDEISILVRRVLASAEVRRVFPVGDTRVVILVPDDELAQAIGREGQNIKLTAKFIEREVDIYGEDEFEEMSEDERTRILTEDEVIEEFDEDVIVDDEALGDDEVHEIGNEGKMADDENVAAMLVEKEVYADELEDPIGVENLDDKSDM